MEMEYRGEKLKKRSKKSKKAKKRRRAGTPVEDEIEFSTEDEAQNEHGGGSSKRNKSPVAPLVEYSDVSSDDFSGPEAGEIESEGGGAGGAADGSLSDISPDERQPIAAAAGNNANTFKSFDKNRLGPMDENSGRSLTPKTTVRRSSKDQLYGESNSSHEKTKTMGLEEIGEESDIESAASDMVIQRKPKKKDKKRHKKKKKKQKKKRAKSVSSVETISEEEDPILAGEPVTPPLTKTGPSGSYTPTKDPSLTPISPTTPPLSPSYASLKKRSMAAASPHTPPMPSKSSSSTHHLARLSSSPDIVHVVHDSSSSRSYYKHRSVKSRTPTGKIRVLVRFHDERKLISFVSDRRPYSPPDKRRRTDSRGDHYVPTYKREQDKSRETYRSKERYRR